MIKALYPGSFDPVTMGHMDIIRRASSICDLLYVGVAVNFNKKPAFTAGERVRFLEASLEGFKNVKVISFDKLLVDVARELGTQVIVKGLRAISDYEYELQMAHINYKLAPDIETVFLAASTRYSYLSSSLVKEVAGLGGCVKDLIPPKVHDDIVRQLSKSHR